MWATSWRGSPSALPPRMTDGRRHPPVQIVASQAMLVELALQEDVEEVPHALVELRVEAVMPLLQPGDQLGQASQQGFQAFHRPAFLRRDFRVPGSQCPRLLQMIPTGPGDGERRIGIAPAKRITDEALLRHVERARRRQ